MTAVYSTLIEGAAYGDLRAATMAIDARLRQSNLLRARRVVRTLVVAGEYVILPMAATLTRVVIAPPNAAIPDGYTVDEALTVAGARLFVSGDALAVGEDEPVEIEGEAYLRLDAHTLRLAEPVEPHSFALVEGQFGHGGRVSIRGNGTWALLDGDPDTPLRQTGGTPLAVGATLQWDDEVFAIRTAGEPDAGGVRAYELERDTPAAHSSTAELWRLDPPADLAWAAGVLGKRLAGIADRPSAGGEFAPAGDTTPSVWRNLESALRAYYRVEGA